MITGFYGKNIFMANEITIKAFKLLKEELGLNSYYKLAEALDLPQTTVARYKNGNVSISIDKFHSILKKKGYQLEIKIKKI